MKALISAAFEYRCEGLRVLWPPLMRALHCGRQRVFKQQWDSTSTFTSISIIYSAHTKIRKEAVIFSGKILDD